MDKNYTSQPALVELLLRRDPKGCQHLCESYSGRLYGFIVRIVKDAKAADRVLEKTFTAICNNIHQYTHSQLTFLTWALQLARSESIDYLCISKQKASFKEDKNKDNTDDTTAVAEIAVFNMIHQGYKVYEVAELLGMTVEDVKLNIRKAMKQKKNAN
ncbi:RNA polymerase sigma factor [Mucilaginibacter xinganensis]|uniref:RNA polymerase sigma-70 region 2 domain-containing protein n=1 Tax=Mucilaginibacter xinganensis TaxID=1234841 RepID=A0A223NSM0_9SPHI|nr:sigma factor [Mucilaginibacter xinganensis]ASU32899.1 hypothetical protein MuYL_0999 [Mucilaginibacter xinganensis]